MRGEEKDEERGEQKVGRLTDRLGVFSRVPKNVSLPCLNSVNFLPRPNSFVKKLVPSILSVRCSMPSLMLRPNTQQTRSNIC